MRFTFYEHQFDKGNLKKVLTRVLEPSDITASVISPQDPELNDGHVN